MSLLELKVNRWLIESLISKQDDIDPVFRFGTINLCPTIEEYSKLLGVPYDTESMIAPSFNQGFKYEYPKLFGSN